MLHISKCTIYQVDEYIFKLNIFKNMYIELLHEESDKSIDTAGNDQLS